MYRNTANVEPEMNDCTSNNWSHWNSNEKLKEKFGNCTRKTFDRFTTKDSYTWNITHNMESTAVWSLKRERWGSPLVQEKYRGEKACDKRQPYRIIIIIIIIIILTLYIRQRLVICNACELFLWERVHLTCLLMCQLYVRICAPQSQNLTQFRVLTPHESQLRGRG